jgi:hypothetical protein
MDRFSRGPASADGHQSIDSRCSTPLCHEAFLNNLEAEILYKNHNLVALRLLPTVKHNVLYVIQ